MTRLVPEALYCNELINEHYIRACIRGENPGPGDWNDYGGSWERAPARIKIIDPEGDKSLTLLRELEGERAKRDKTRIRLVNTLKQISEKKR